MTLALILTGVAIAVTFSMLDRRDDARHDLSDDGDFAASLAEYSPIHESHHNG